MRAIINRSELFKRANSLRKVRKISLSEALTLAWAHLKAEYLYNAAKEWYDRIEYQKGTEATYFQEIEKQCKARKSFETGLRKVQKAFIINDMRTPQSMIENAFRFLKQFDYEKTDKCLLRVLEVVFENKFEHLIFAA